MNYFTPTYRLHRFTDLTARDLLGAGITCLITDLDDTLAPRNVFDPTDEVRRWIDTLRENGIAVGIVSNNSETRTARYARALSLPYRFRAKKPSKRKIRAAMAELNGTEKTTALLGDQLFTDVAAAKRCGIRSILVDPIGSYGGWFVQFKRKLERPLRKKIPYRLFPESDD